MKNAEKKMAVLAITLLIFSATYGQEKAPLQIYGGLVYGTEISELGMTVGVEFDLSEKINLAPNFSYFFTPSGRTVYSINADGKYNFTSGDTQFYGLLGASLGVVSVKLGTVPGRSELGLNVGGGVKQALSDNLSFNGQLRYNTPFSQLESWQEC